MPTRRRGGDFARFGRRADRPGLVPRGSPFDFAAEDDERLDPVDLSVIRADDELLDTLASGRAAGPGFGSGWHAFVESSYRDEQQMLAMLGALRAEVESESFPELVSLDDACAAIATGRRSERPERVLRGSPFDFGVEDNELVDPVDRLASSADDELLDTLASGRAVGPGFGSGRHASAESSYRDEQQILAMLGALRAEVESEPFPELVSLDEACAAIATGQRSSRPRRRLMPVAAAAAVVVLGLSGVAIAATDAQPGDPLWGLSTVLDDGRAKSVEAAYQVDLALTAAQQALALGRVSDAQQIIKKVEPKLFQIRDTQRKDALSSKSANLLAAAARMPEGQSVHTDQNGVARDRGPNPQPRQEQPPNSAGAGLSNEPRSRPSSTQDGGTAGADQQRQDQRGQRGTRDQQGRRDQQGTGDQQGTRDQRGRRDQQGMRDHQQGTRDHEGTQDQRGARDQQSSGDSGSHHRGGGGGRGGGGH
jgi:hypothetical protein